MIAGLHVEAAQKLGRLSLSLFLCINVHTVRQKATRIWTTAPWMKLVRALCDEVGPRIHVPSIRQAWRYLEEAWVWCTSLAAECPCGLCLAWALNTWPQSSLGKTWLAGRTMRCVGKWNIVLVRSALVTPEEAVAVDEFNREQRDIENAKALGRLKNPRHAVRPSAQLRSVGARIRRVIDKLIDTRLLDQFENDINSGVDKQVVEAVCNALASEFSTSVAESGLQHGLWLSMLAAAQDPDAECLAGWISDGFEHWNFSCY